jgi:hypothetical protein
MAGMAGFVVCEVHFMLRYRFPAALYWLTAIV